MSDIFDYLRWRGDLSFRCDGFNEVDNLLLSGLAYIDYGGIVPIGSCRRYVTLADALQRLQAEGRCELKGPFLTRYPELLASASKTERFRNVRLTCYVSELDDRKANQFSAIVFSYGHNEHYIAFRGTDDNLAGWKEDFLMSFKAVVLAQAQALNYVNTVIPQLRGQIYIGGHSKGGNLAVYAAANTTARNKKKIKLVFNNDGPGFQPSMTASEGYKQIETRIRTYLPNTSIVGMLLEHGEAFEIISSTGNGIMSHNPLTWEICGTSFLRKSELSKTSRQIDKSLRTWLDSLTLSQREQFVEALFDIIQASGAQTLTDLSKEGLAVIDAGIKKLKSMDKETRTLLRTTIMDFFTVRQRILRESISENLEALKAKKPQN